MFFLSAFACAFEHIPASGLREYAGEISLSHARRNICVDVEQTFLTACTFTVKQLGVCCMSVSGGRVGTLCILRAVINTRGSKYEGI